MPAPQHRICLLAEEAATTTEPETALEKLRELRDELVAFERARVAQALRTGSSFGSVAKALGISRQAAHRRYRELSPPQGKSLSLSLSSQVRQAIRLAREEAAAAGARGLSSGHLLLGVLRSGGGTSSALEAGGVTADATRKCLRSDGDGDSPGDPAATAETAKAVLAEAAQIARARHARSIEADHLVLAALNGPDGGARRAVTALGVTPAAVRRRLGC